MPTYNDLEQAFKNLNSQGIIAKHNYLCCQSCGYAALDNEVKKAQAAGQEPLGVTFYHSQDTEHAIAHNYLYLSHSAASDKATDEQHKLVGRLIVGALKAQGFAPQWSGEQSDRIKIPIGGYSMETEFPPEDDHSWEVDEDSE